MKIKVKLVSMPGHQPSGFDDFGNSLMQLSDKMTISGLISEMKLSKIETYMVLVNGEAVPPSTHSQHILEDTDYVTIFTPMEVG